MNRSNHESLQQSMNYYDLNTIRQSQYQHALNITSKSQNNELKTSSNTNTHKMQKYIDRAGEKTALNYEELEAKTYSNVKTNQIIEEDDTSYLKRQIILLRQQVRDKDEKLASMERLSLNQKELDNDQNIKYEQFKQLQMDLLGAKEQVQNLQHDIIQYKKQINEQCSQQHNQHNQILEQNKEIQRYQEKIIIQERQIEQDKIQINKLNQLNQQQDVNARSDLINQLQEQIKQQQIQITNCKQEIQRLKQILSKK